MYPKEVYIGRIPKHGIIWLHHRLLSGFYRYMHTKNLQQYYRNPRQIHEVEVHSNWQNQNSQTFKPYMCIHAGVGLGKIRILFVCVCYHQMFEHYFNSRNITPSRKLRFLVLVWFYLRSSLVWFAHDICLIIWIL